MQHGRARLEPMWLPAGGVTAPRRASLAVPVALLCALIASALFILFDHSMAARGIATALSIALAAALATVLGKRPARIGRWLSIEGERLSFVARSAKSSAPEQPLLWLHGDAPFGATLLANRDRNRLVLALTTLRKTIYVSTRVGPVERRGMAPLLARACTVADDEPALDAVGPDGEPLVLSTRDFALLYESLVAVDAAAPGRCFLVDTHGNEVVLTGDELRVDHKMFDLAAPLEWRAMVFQEPTGASPPPMGETGDRTTDAGGGAVMVYQATWIRQGGNEVVLVATLASLAGGTSAGGGFVEGDAPDVQRAVLRDLRLMQASPDMPPPRELRVGIERVYMLPLRAAVDRAPRSSRKDMPSGAAIS